ncbi:60S acidic ribosomal protein P0-like [Bactrocera tryoni]|uniref:60S acidic ribosomal protein P0-like n=1 Tax=Bactrocera tryoni TaxID=59916 RepID=UPI001A96BDE6|nr:60S acidic ribosomal protein P0-like [Bactrocera tryoni]
MIIAMEEDPMHFPGSMRQFAAGAPTSASIVSLQIVYQTIASTPHSVAKDFNNLLAIAAATEVDFKEAAGIKEFIKNPSKFVAAAADPVPATGAGAAAENKEEPKKEESESEEDADTGFGLFD